MANYVITIALGFGSGGKDIAVHVAERLGIPCYEKEILEMASQQSGIGEDLFNARDEKLGRGYFANRILNSVPHDYAVEASDRRFTHDNNLFAIQSGIIRELAASFSCVIVGKCADSVLGIEVPCLRVFINAPMEACVRSIMNRMSVSPLEAERLILKTNRYRSDYYRYYTQGKDWYDPLNYDLCLNTGMIPRDRCAELIVEALHRKYDPVDS